MMQTAASVAFAPCFPALTPARRHAGFSRPLTVTAVRHNRSPERLAMDVNAMPEAPPVRDTDLGNLVRRAADGDQSALAALYDKTSRLLHGLILRIVGDAADADDGTLDVYTHAWRQARRYDPARGDAITWLL